MNKWPTITSVMLLCLFLAVAHAMDPLEDRTLADIDAKAGISVYGIGTDASIEYSLSGLSWGDDDGYTAAGFQAAGHLAIRGMTLDGGTKVPLSITYTIPSTGPVTYDVDAVGVFIGMPDLLVAVTAPPRMQFSVSDGPVSSFAGVRELNTTKVAFDLALDDFDITVSLPNNIRLSPH